MIITNREEVIDKAFGVFVRMNYEKASIITLAKACGVTKTGIVYYFPHKLDLFMAVADKYVLKMHEPGNKFAAPADTLEKFIGQYVAGVAASMKRIVELIDDNSSPHDCSQSYGFDSEDPSAVFDGRHRDLQPHPEADEPQVRPRVVYGPRGSHPQIGRASCRERV